jgi:POT family proton-dependent oligopeptide transporter
MIIGTTTFVLYRSIFLKSVDGQEIGLAPTFKGVIKDDSETDKAEFSTKFILVTILLFVTFTFGFHKLFKEEIPNLINDWVYPIIFSSFFSLGFLVITERNLTKIERDRIMAIFIIAFFVFKSIKVLTKTI